MARAIQARSVEELIQLIAQSKQPKYLYFWGHKPKVRGRLDSSCFSQWYPAPFEAEGIKYPTAEHYMMTQKAHLFGDSSTCEKILMAESPGKAKALGRQVLDFNQEEWEKERFRIVVEGTLRKFESSHALQRLLLGTTGRVLVEASPTDRIWGIGLTAEEARMGGPSKWRGLNLLGFALMEARARLDPNAP